MGGRGATSGVGVSKGFSYTRNGKTVMVKKTASGQVLVNGTPAKGLDFNKMLESAKSNQGFKTYSSTQLAQMTEKRHKNYTAHDYELMENTRGKGKSVYRPRRSR